MAFGSTELAINLMPRPPGHTGDRSELIRARHSEKSVQQNGDADGMHKIGGTLLGRALLSCGGIVPVFELEGRFGDYFTATESGCGVSARR